MNRDKIVEKIAALQHKQWAGWARWMIDKWSPEMVERWERQIKTPYAELSDREKESDRDEARKVIALLGFFDLFEAAKVYHEQYRPGRGVFPALGTCEICKGPTRTISNKICEKCVWEKLNAAIAKITGGVGA